ncbi:MAG: Holliday junction resolvase RuvX [Terriglobia bacterium]
MRIMALDVGSVRIGVAVSDETGIIARGLETLVRKSWEQDLGRIQHLIRENEVSQLVVGYPLNLDGSAGTQAEQVQQFVERLQAVTDLDVQFWDERFSSTSAEKVLIEGGVQRHKRKQVIDKLAAVIILQNFLDHRCLSQSKDTSIDQGGDSDN